MDSSSWTSVVSSVLLSGGLASVVTVMIQARQHHRLVGAMEHSAAQDRSLRFLETSLAYAETRIGSLQNDMARKDLQIRELQTQLAAMQEELRRARSAGLRDEP